jgi:flagellar FliL protein
MAKKKKTEEPQEDAPEGQAAEADAPKTGFVKKLFGNKKLLIVVAAGLLLVLGGGGAGQSADGSPAYLKLSTSLELETADEKAGVTALMPRIVDQFQGYLRELRIDDLKGSAGVLRLKEELLRRINAAAAPYRVRDVLLKEMIVQ